MIQAVWLLTQKVLIPNFLSGILTGKVAGILGYKDKPLFEASPEDKKDVDIKFDFPK